MSVEQTSEQVRRAAESRKRVIIGNLRRELADALRTAKQGQALDGGVGWSLMVLGLERLLEDVDSVDVDGRWARGEPE